MGSGVSEVEVSWILDSGLVGELGSEFMESVSSVDSSEMDSPWDGSDSVGVS